MDHHDWAICACLKFKNDKELFYRDRPFRTYHIEAPTAKAAIKQFKKNFAECDIIMHGEPVHSIVTEEEFENGD